MTNGESRAEATAEPADVRSELAQALADEFNQAGIECTVVAEAIVREGKDEYVMPAQIVVPLDEDPAGRTPEARVYFLPVLENPPVVQYTVFLDYEVVDGAGADLARFIALANSQLTLTGFEMSETYGQVVFRHTHAVDPNRIDPGVIAWPLSVIRESVDTYGPLVERVANGHSLGEAVAALSAVVSV